MGAERDAVCEARAVHGDQPRGQQRRQHNLRPRARLRAPEGGREGARWALGGVHGARCAMLQLRGRGLKVGGRGPHEHEDEADVLERHGERVELEVEEKKGADDEPRDDERRATGA